MALAFVSALFALQIPLSGASSPSAWSLWPRIERFSPRAANDSSAGCDLDQSKAPGNLTLCGNSTLFQVWRPKARFIAPEGWMNDPQGLWQRKDGSYHAGYQCHPQHIQWGNISQCSAFSKDLVYWEDAHSWKDPKTLWPSTIYDIRGVFDGSIIADGWNGLPTTIYTSTFTLPLGAAISPPEQQGTETQSIAYTEDGGLSWTKLNLGANPVIYEWPEQNLTGFRDPFAFKSPHLAALLANSTSVNNTASGDYFLTISGGIRLDADPSGGPRLFLYRQTRKGDVTKWTYLGPIVAVPGQSSFSEWSGNVGLNFETAGITRLNEAGRASDSGNDPNALDVITYGTELGRNGSHENHWPLWAAVDYSTQNGSVSSTTKFAGVLDWGRSYAFTYFPVTTNGKSREVLIGWTYEDDEALVLTSQRGYQGAFTLFRDLFVKVIGNVDPSAPGLNDTASSWTTRKEKDGSTSVITVGQKVIPEILTAYRRNSRVSTPRTRTLAISRSSNVSYTPFESQPRGRFYAVTGRFTYRNASTSNPKVGFRVLASSQEWTDVYFDPANETVVVQREHSSLISSFGNDTEYAKLRLFNVLDRKSGLSTPQSLNLTVFVDNSVVEVYANDQAVITTRAYPWLSTSKGAGFIAAGGSTNASVSVSDVEVWDGLLNAWPKRPTDTRKELLYDGPLPSSGWSVWAGF